MPPVTERKMPFGIPSTAGIADPSLRAILEAIIANQQVAYGVSGQRDQWLVTHKELVQSSSHGRDNLGRLVKTAVKSTQVVQESGGKGRTWLYLGPNMRVSLSSGEVQVKNDDTGLFHSIWVEGAVGYGQLVCDPTGEA